MIVKATREGKIGDMTSSNWRIDAEYPFVALPSRKALGMWMALRNPLNGKICCAQVLDVGPWNTHDDNYVFGSARPLAEQGISVSGRGTNGAGIDLGEKVWGLLGMRDNTDVEWEFADRVLDRTPQPAAVQSPGLPQAPTEGSQGDPA